MAKKIKRIDLSTSGNETVYSDTLFGRVLMVVLTYGAGSATTVDTTIEDEVSGDDFISLTDSSSNRVLRPRVKTQDLNANNLDSSNNPWVEYIVAGRIAMTTAQQNTAIAVDAGIYLEEF